MSRLTRSGIVTFMFALALIGIPRAAQAQGTWNATVGAESRNEGIQADAFLPNELWIYQGDTIIWKFAPKNEIHTVTFLMPSQIRPPFQGPPSAGCPGIQPSGSSYDGVGAPGDLGCVNSGPLAGGATYSVKFPVPGNFKLVCLVHADMNGTIHVLPLSANLPHQQGFYDQLGADEAHDILADDKNSAEEREDSSRHSVIAGIGEIVATGGGRQYQAVVRFLRGTIRVNVGDTVEWTNLDPTEPHTVTFGTEPPIPTTVVNATPDLDGALHSTIHSSTDSTNSGFLAAAPQDRVGLSQSDPGVTRFRVTFTTAGTYHYICALHDVDGMVGEVIVGGGGDRDDDRDPDQQR